MSNHKKSIIVFWVLLFLSGLAYAAYLVSEEFRMARETAERSCMASIAAAVDKAWADGKLELNEHSRELTNKEINMILAENGIYDCSGKKYILDEVRIAIGDVNNVARESRIRVWTNGRDGVSGTRDDLVIPWGENERF